MAEAAAAESSSERQWQAFLDAAVHEVRSALRAVGTSVDLLATAGELPDTSQPIHILREGVRRLDALSQGLANYARALHADSFNEFVPVESVLRFVLEEFRETVTRIGADIRHEKLPAVSGNREQITILFRELLGNALLYHSATPRIQITAFPHEPGMWRFAVKDNGLGIQQQYWDKIFEPFQRLYSQPKRNGLGLAISKKIVEAHGGVIRLESEPGAGSTFFFTLLAAG